MKRGNTSKIAMTLILIVAGGLPGAGASPGAERARAAPVPVLAAVEIDDLPGRWNELRGIPAIARFQDRVLGGSGIDPDDLPALAGERATVVLVAGENGRSVVPVFILKTAAVERATSMLAATGWSVKEVNGTLWVAPPGKSGFLDGLAEAGLDIVPPSPADWRYLGDRTLARGRVDTAALRSFLRSQVPGTRPAPVEWLSASIAAELEATRYVEFRREVLGKEVVTEAVVGYDTEALPPEVAGILRSYASSPPLPDRLPAGVAAAGSFRPEGEACIPWLRYVANDDPRGVLRHLDFWIGEMEDRTGRDLDRDLFGSLGEHAWWFVTGGDRAGAVGAVALMETVDERLLEETLVDLASWYAEHVSGRTLGLVAPRTVEFSVEGRPAHGLAIDTFVGDFRGPAFMVANGHLLAATGADALRTGLRILETRSTWKAPAEDPGPHGSVRIDGPALAQLSDLLVNGGEQDPLAGSVIDLLGELEDVAIDFWYEDGAIRLRSRLRFR